MSRIAYGRAMKVFFDVDGVLIDGWHADPARRRRWDDTLRADLGIDPDALQRQFFLGPAAPMADCLAGRRDLGQALAEVLARIGHPGRADAVMRYWFDKDSAVDAAMLGLAADIRRRGGACTYLATSQDHHRARHLWHGLGFSAHFDDMFHSARVGHPKTDPRFFQAVNRALDIGPDERPLFFDDDARIVALARAAGWDATVCTGAADVQRHPRLRHLWT